jgi:hypothetical protein
MDRLSSCYAEIQQEEFIKRKKVAVEIKTVLIIIGLFIGVVIVTSFTLPCSHNTNPIRVMIGVWICISATQYRNIFL